MQPMSNPTESPKPTTLEDRRKEAMLLSDELKKKHWRNILIEQREGRDPDRSIYPKLRGH